MIVTLIIFIVILWVVIIWYIWDSFKKAQNEYAIFEINKKAIMDKIEKINSVEDCYNVMTEIRNYYHNTNPIYKPIMEEYLKLYNLVSGIKIGLEKK